MTLFAMQPLPKNSSPAYESPTPRPGASRRFRSGLSARALVAVGLLGLASAAGLVSACDDPTKGQAKASAAAPVASTAAADSAGAAYAITPQSSKVEWTGSKVTGSHDGSFTSFSGTITLVGGSIEKSRVTIDIDTPSLTTNSDKLIGHLKSPDFFGVEQFPKATFASTSIKARADEGKARADEGKAVADAGKAGGDKGAGYQVTGNLTLHGVTKSIAFPANISVSGGSVNADATFSINRKDFNISYPGKVDDVIRDDVLIKLTLRATKAT